MAFIFCGEIFGIIVENTNRLIRWQGANVSRPRNINNTDQVVCEKKSTSIENFWKIMFKKRFLFLLRSLPFDDEINERKSEYKLVPL